MKRVICVKSCLLVVITILASFSVSIVSVNSSNNSEQAFITHNPIIINGNSEFLSFVSSDSLSGSGTSNDPYIVENLLLNSSSDIQISIKNVDLYFIIQNNIIENGNKQGILLDTVSNAIIKGNQLSDNTGDAINVIDSSNIIISNNLIQNTKGTSTSLNKYGRVDFPFTMDIAYSDNILVEKNTLNHNYDGIWFWLNTNNSIMRENIVNGSTTFEGLGIGGLGAHDDIVEDNIVTNITRYAIWSYSANNSIIKNNSIAKAVDGIRIDASKFLDIRNNTVENTNTY
ncbi:MAG: right-handed parallel beta-helix repeat-containing protein, partial [Candidatus Thorarchaeota archaeon]